MSQDWHILESCNLSPGAVINIYLLTLNEIVFID